MLTKQQLENQRESIQQDLLCILDGLDAKIQADVCQVDRFEILIIENEI